MTGGASAAAREGAPTGGRGRAMGCRWIRTAAGMSATAAVRSAFPRARGTAGAAGAAGAAAITAGLAAVAAAPAVAGRGCWQCDGSHKGNAAAGGGPNGGPGGTLGGGGPGAIRCAACIPGGGPGGTPCGMSPPMAAP